VLRILPHKSDSTFSGNVSEEKFSFKHPCFRKNLGPSTLQGKIWKRTFSRAQSEKFWGLGRGAVVVCFGNFLKITLKSGGGWVLGKKIWGGVF
jgi:hypothetical protein